MQIRVDHRAVRPPRHALHRFGLGDALLQLAEKTGIPYATTIDGKTALPEKHPLFMGVYMGALSRDAVKSQMENSDGLLSFGAMTTDVNTGGFTARLPEQYMVRAHKDRVRVSSHFYDRVWMGEPPARARSRCLHRPCPERQDLRDSSA